MATTEENVLTVDGVDFEHWPIGMAMDETDRAVRAYITRIPEEKLAEYNPDWTDEELMEWDGNFRMDGGLMLVCVERDVEPSDFREVFEQYLDFRKRAGA